MARQVQKGDCPSCSVVVRWLAVRRFEVPFQDARDVAQDVCVSCLRRGYRSRAFRWAWSTVLKSLVRSAAYQYRQREFATHEGECPRAARQRQAYWGNVEQSRAIARTRMRDRRERAKAETQKSA